MQSKAVSAKLTPPLDKIIKEAKKQGYTEAEIVREGIRLFGKQMKTKPMEATA